MKNAVIILMTRYPNGDAGAVRGHAIAKLLSLNGYDVTVIGYGEYTGKEIRCYDGIKYTSLRLRNGSIPGKVVSRLTHGKRLYKYIRRNFKSVDLFVCDYIRTKTFALVEKLAGEYGAQLWHDSCEWFSKEEFKNGERNSLYKYCDRVNTETMKKPWNIISISSYLDEHFRSRGLLSVRIPVILDVCSMEYNAYKNNEKTIFLYAGSPGKKDYLSEIVRAFALLDGELLSSLELHIIGVSREGLLNISGVRGEDLDRLGESVIIHGRLPREKAVEWVRRADFTVLLRNSELRYTKAGFPTKVVESLSSATPVITNLTSDLGMYLVSGVNSVISSSFTAEAFRDALVYAMNMSEDERQKMSVAARSLAEECFDYRVFKDYLG